LRQGQEAGDREIPLQVAPELGISFELVPMLPVSDRIEARRRFFRRLCFDEDDLQGLAEGDTAVYERVRRGQENI
jgi:hypothetical protein